MQIFEGEYLQDREKASCGCKFLQGNICKIEKRQVADANLRRRILEEADSERGLRAPRGLSTAEQIAAFESKNLSKQKTEASIKELQERIVHLEKQVEFLKKTSNIMTNPTLK